jgi:DNA-binding transcriptional LysR family regulator
MELYRLKSFMAIAETGNLTKAANKLHISQSALSSQLKQLEEELEFVLFKRTPRGMQLNESGREILHQVEILLDAEDKLLKKARLLRHNIVDALQIGLNADPGFLRVGAINRRLQQLHNDLNVIFLTSQTVRTAQMLRKGQLDLAFLYGETTELSIRSEKLVDVSFCVVIPKELQAGGEDLDWPQLAELPWVWVEQGSPPYDAMLEKFANLRLQPKQLVKTVDEYIVKELVLEGQGVAIMREDEARPLVDKGQVTIWPRGWLTVPLSLAWTAENSANPNVLKVREVIRYLWQPAKPEGIEGGSFNY